MSYFGLSNLSWFEDHISISCLQCNLFIYNQLSCFILHRLKSDVSSSFAVLYWHHKGRLLGCNQWSRRNFLNWKLGLFWIFKHTLWLLHWAFYAIMNYDLNKYWCLCCRDMYVTVYLNWMIWVLDEISCSMICLFISKLTLLS